MGISNINELLMRSMREEIGRRLKAQRAYQNMSQIHCAELMGCSVETVRGVEQRGTVTLQSMLAYAKAVGVPVSAVLEGIEPYPLEPQVDPANAPPVITRQGTKGELTPEV